MTRIPTRQDFEREIDVLTHGGPIIFVRCVSSTQSGNRCETHLHNFSQGWTEALRQLHVVRAIFRSTFHDAEEHSFHLIQARDLFVSVHCTCAAHLFAADSQDL